MRFRSLVLFASAAVLFAACGGDDSGSSATPAPGNLPTIPDDLQEAIDAGDTDAIEQGVDEMMEGLDDMISSFGGDGGGTVTVDGVTYTVEADVCISGPTDFTIDGPAVGSDGSVAWVQVSWGITNREDLADFMSEDMLDNMFPGGATSTEDMSIDVSVGQTTRMESIDDQPQWSAVSGDIFAIGGGLDYEPTGNGVRGTGEALDVNFVVGTLEDTVPIQFDVACN